MLTLNAERLRAMIREMYISTRIRMVLFDGEGRELLSYPEGRGGLCAWIRGREEGARRCRKCDLRALRQCRDTWEPLIYSCHAGMTEAVIPLKEKDALLGYLMLGQVLCGREERRERERLRLSLAGEEWIQEDLSALMDAVPWKTPEEINACATLLKMMTVYLLSANLVALPRAAFTERMDQYLEAHLAEPITVEALRAYFGVSRSALYQQSLHQLGCGLAEYIRRYRLRAACRLLETTALPIGEIGARVGFADQNNFCRAFRRQMGMTARQYRKDHRVKGKEG